MIFSTGSGRPMLSSVYEILAWPWIWPSLKKQRAICVGYCGAASQYGLGWDEDGIAAAIGTHCHLGVFAPLVCGDADRDLERPLNVALLRIHVQQLGPWLVGVSRGIQTALVRLLRLLLVVEAHAKVT